MESIKPGFIIFGPFLIFVLIFLKTEKKLYAILAGIFYGLLFYTYTFFWIYGTIILGLLGFLYFLKKKFQELFWTVISVSIGALLSIYFWITYFKAKNLSWIDTYIHRVGWVELSGHRFRTSQWFLYLIFLISLAFLYRFEKKRGRMFVAYFLGILLVAGFIGLNIQLVTGTNIQPSHWQSRIIFIPLTLTFLILAEGLISILERRGLLRKYVNIFLVIVIFSVFSGGAYTAYKYARERYNSFHLPSGIMPSFYWMNANLPRDAVVLTPIPYLNELFLFYTPAKIFLPKAAGTMASEEEMIERMFIVYKLFNVQSSYLDKELRIEARDDEMRNKKFPAMYISLFDYLFFQQFFSQALDAAIYIDSSVTKIPRWKVDQMVSDYKLYQLDISELGKKYKADYIYVGPLEVEISMTNFETLPNLEKVYAADGVIIYKIKNVLKP